MPLVGTDPVLAPARAATAGPVAPPRRRRVPPARMVAEAWAGTGSRGRGLVRDARRPSVPEKKIIAHYRFRFAMIYPCAQGHARGPARVLPSLEGVPAHQCGRRGTGTGVPMVARARSQSAPGLLEESGSRRRRPADEAVTFDEIRRKQHKGAQLVRGHYFTFRRVSPPAGGLPGAIEGQRIVDAPRTLADRYR